MGRARALIADRARNAIAMEAVTVHFNEDSAVIACVA
jgi:hypothetical protein